jgi:hypothetical protein
MSKIFKEMNINRKFEHDMFHLSNEIHDRKTGQIQDDTSEILIGAIKDDFENKKEIFIPAKDI